jgi:hypothetical protein
LFTSLVTSTSQQTRKKNKELLRVCLTLPFTKGEGLGNGNDSCGGALLEQLQKLLKIGKYRKGRFGETGSALFTILVTPFLGGKYVKYRLVGARVRATPHGFFRFIGRTSGETHLTPSLVTKCEEHEEDHLPAQPNPIFPKYLHLLLGGGCGTVQSLAGAPKHYVGRLAVFGKLFYKTLPVLVWLATVNSTPK